ncbi:hypothetical protein GE21DRAFT_1053888 [Neurospora crassa]|nr:hypothetical protein GE21DRAFT_1053888 [Neurospora crassa]
MSRLPRLVPRPNHDVQPGDALKVGGHFFLPLLRPPRLGSLPLHASHRSIGPFIPRRPSFSSLHTQLHIHPSIENLSHWLVALLRQKAQQRVHTCTEEATSSSSYWSSEVTQKAKRTCVLNGVFLDMVQLVPARKPPPLQIAPSTLNSLLSNAHHGLFASLSLASNSAVIVGSKKPLQSWISMTRLYVHVPRRQT